MVRDTSIHKHTSNDQLLLWIIEINPHEKIIDTFNDRCWQIMKTSQQGRTRYKSLMMVEREKRYCTEYSNEADMKREKKESFTRGGLCKQFAGI